MKAIDTVTLGVVALAAGVIFLKNRQAQSTSGIGATKRAPRRIWSEVEWAQKHGIDLTDPNGWEKHIKLLSAPAEAAIKTESNKPKEQRYFNQLRRAYRSVAGTGLPSTQSVVRNEYGDVILVYNDYHLDQLPTVAAEWVENELVPGTPNNEEMAYYKTLADIALGHVKFVWKGDDKIHRGAEGMVFGHAAPMEKKKRISYLASPSKGGQYIDEYAHHVWETVTDGNGDDHEITNGIIEAIRDCGSVKDARDFCIDQYIKAHAPQEPALYEDVPF